MRDDLRDLDKLEMDDLWEQARSRTPRPEAPGPERPVSSRVVVVIAAFLIAGSTFAFFRSGFAEGDRSVDPGTASSEAYTDPSGWTIGVPSGWDVQPFELPSPYDIPIEGAMISNMSLPPPIGPPDAQPQAGGSGFPDSGVALVISTTVPVWFGGQVWEPPLSVDDMWQGSSPDAASTLDGLTFSSPGGRWFTATLRIGSDAPPSDVEAVASVVASLTFAQSLPSSQAQTDIASVEPMPSTVVLNGAAELMPELTDRLATWGTLFGVESMTEEELVASMDILTEAVASLEETEDEWLRTRELLMRRTLLCQLLPVDHEYRGGEYCV